jgi:hypothetical protein
MDNIDNLLLDLNKEISGITTFDIDNLDEIILKKSITISLKSLLIILN